VAITDFITVIISFRGSRTIDNWVRGFLFSFSSYYFFLIDLEIDFEFIQTKYPPVTNALVHDGFYSVWKCKSLKYNRTNSLF
jgi:hypothetical protein